MPGPSGTLSRCAPTTMSWPSPPTSRPPARCGSTGPAHGVDGEMHGGAVRALRFRASGRTRTRRRPPGRRRPAQLAGKSVGPARVPSFMMTTPAAPAATAFSTLVWNVQVPRRISATEPRSKPRSRRRRSRWSMPPAVLAEPKPHRAQRRRHVARTGVGERANRTCGRRFLLAVGRAHGQDRRRALLEEGEIEFFKTNRIAGALQSVRDVFRGTIVARRCRRHGCRHSRRRCPAMPAGAERRPRSPKARPGRPRAWSPAGSPVPTRRCCPEPRRPAPWRHSSLHAKSRS